MALTPQWEFFPADIKNTGAGDIYKVIGEASNTRVRWCSGVLRMSHASPPIPPWQAALGSRELRPQAKAVQGQNPSTGKAGCPLMARQLLSVTHNQPAGGW